MELEITPDPTPEERRAIELALKADDEARSAWAQPLAPDADPLALDGQCHTWARLAGGSDAAQDRPIRP